MAAFAESNEQSSTSGWSLVSVMAKGFRQADLAPEARSELGGIPSGAF